MAKQDDELQELLLGSLPKGSDVQLQAFIRWTRKAQQTLLAARYTDKDKQDAIYFYRRAWFLMTYIGLDEDVPQMPVQPNALCTMQPRDAIEAVRVALALPLGVLKRRLKPHDKRPANTVDEANAVVVKLAKKDTGFVGKGIRQWAAAIKTATGKTCSLATVEKTALWIATMKEMGRGRTKGKAPKAVSLTGGLEAVTGEGGRHQVLQDLIAEQTADDDDRPAARRKHYKRV